MASSRKNVKSIKWLLNKIPRSRGCAAELFSVGFRVSFNRMQHEIAHCNDVLSDVQNGIRAVVSEVRTNQKSNDLRMDGFHDRITTLERWLYVITFALIVALFLLITLIIV